VPLAPPLVAPPHAPLRLLPVPRALPALRTLPAALPRLAPAPASEGCGRHYQLPFDGGLSLRSAYKRGDSFAFCPQHSAFGHVRGGRNHWGLDISSPTGTAVHAAVDGQLTYARNPGGYGFYAKLRFVAPVHRRNGACGPGEEHEILYAHLVDDSSRVGASRAVRAGEIIGHVGCSGNAQGMCSPSPESHLHVTVQRHGTHIEPGAFLGWSVGMPHEVPAGWSNCGRPAARPAYTFAALRRK
jgi:murein DD-endopeptidase MepM/ murein hydrolase activator NlpD